MNYFKFEIPTNADGSRVTYSKGWFGTMPKCPANVTVLLYNDKEGYGIAQTPDPIKQPEITELTSIQKDTELKAVIDEDGVYKGAIRIASKFTLEAEVNDGG